MNDDQKRPRVAERLRHELMVAYETPKGLVTDWAVNISTSGLFINTKTFLPVGSSIKIIISLPDKLRPFELHGTVVRVDGAETPSAVPGLGVKFDQIDEEKRGVSSASSIASSENSSNSLRAGAEHVADVIGLDKRGHGVVRLGKSLVKVPGAWRGEKIRCTSEGVLLAVLEAVPERRTPPCTLADRCGGCGWLHVTEEAQREVKVQWVRETFPDLPLTVVDTATPSLGYRRRTTLHRSQKGFAYFARRSHDPCVIDTCPALTQRLAPLPGVIARALGPAIGQVSELSLLSTADAASAAWELTGNISPRVREAATALVRAGTLQGVLLKPSKGAPEEVGEPTLREGLGLRRPDLFAQPSVEGNRALQTLVGEFLQLSGKERVLELYAGDGNLTLPHCDGAKDWVAVESDRSALGLARRAAGARANLRFVQGDCKEVSEGLQKEGARFERALLDPPRVGAPGMAQILAGLGAELVVYLSCEPVALDRDAREFRSAGYTATAVALVDQFPQTRHYEAVVAFRRSSGEE